MAGSLSLTTYVLVEVLCTSNRSAWRYAVIVLPGLGHRLRVQPAKLPPSDHGRPAWDALGKVQREQGDAGRFPWLYTPFIPAGSVRDELVINEDIAPTFLDLAGMKNAPGTMHGRSLRPLFRARHTDWRKSFLFQYFLDPPYPEVPIAFALRTDNPKLIRYETNPDWVELFDLKSDPYETANLAGQLAHRPLLEELQLELVRQAEAVHCQLPAPLRTLPR